MARKVTVGLFAIITIVGLGFGVYGMTYAYNTKIQQPTELWNYTCGNTISEIAISEDGNYIAVASFDGNMYFFNKDGQLLWKKNFGNDYCPIGVDLTADGTYIVVTVQNIYKGNDTVYLYNNAGTNLGSFTTRSIYCKVDITPNGKYMAVIGAGQVGAYIKEYVYFFNLHGGKMPTSYQWRWPLPEIYSLSSLEIKITDDGSYVLVLTHEGIALNERYVVYLLKGKGYMPSDPVNKSNTPLWNFSAPMGSYINHVDISQDGEYIAVGTSGSDNNALYLLNNDGSLKWIYYFEHGGDVMDISISYDNQYVAVNIGGTLYLFSTDSNTPLWKDNSLCCGSMTFCKDINIIIASGDNRHYKYYIWSKDVNNDTIWRLTTDYEYEISEKSVSGNGQYFAVTTYPLYSVHFFGSPPSSENFVFYLIIVMIIVFIVVVSLVIILRGRRKNK